MKIFYTILAVGCMHNALQAFDTSSLAHKVTVITTTSPIKSNPRTDMIEATQQSLHMIPALRDCKKIIVFDGFNEGGYGSIPHKSLQDIKEDYVEFKRRMQQLVDDPNNIYFKNTELLFLDEFQHQAWAVRAAMEHVTTPFVYIHQHDFLIIREFDVVNMIRTMEDNLTVKLIRVCNGENNPNYFDGPVDTYVEGTSYVPLVRTFRFSDCEHFTTVKYYHDVVFPRVHGKCFAEFWMMEPGFKEHQQEMLKNHAYYGMYVYGRMGEPTCLHHLDGRQSVR
jgi:hypothetical protein